MNYPVDITVTVVVDAETEQEALAKAQLVAAMAIQQSDNVTITAYTVYTEEI